MTLPARKPFSIQIIEPAFPAFQQACALIRSGYVFAPDLPVELTPNGNAIFTLVLGTPDHNAVNKANEATEHALMLEASAYERAVEARAKMLLDDYKKEQLRLQVDAMKAQQAKDIAALEKATAAAIAKIQ
ncbi:hypothetical protein [Massilia niastensis]|uniref:hypothetical protein n=1 Tax=Massilia niastensis TaxID=544911 RepID=UPI00036A6F35|nr:hypothetical protein [Massilia niastensis]